MTTKQTTETQSATERLDSMFCEDSAALPAGPPEADLAAARAYEKPLPGIDAEAAEAKADGAEASPEQIAALKTLLKPA